MSKKFIGDPSKAVGHALDMMTMTNHGVERLVGTNVIVRTEVATDQVSLVCGGGSGHEPAHAGFVADGLLAAAVCGDVFASPPHATITTALNHLYAKGADKHGILVIVKNYGGDLINFGYAVRVAKAQGMKIEMVVAKDDVALGLHNDARRGIAGTVPLYKVLGAAAKAGHSLKELVSLSNHVSLNMRSMGASMTSCSIPGSACADPIPDDQMEVGLGIHGEKGLSREGVKPVADIVDTLLEKIVNGEKTSDRWAAGEHVALMVNNLGATTDIEMGVVTYTAIEQLREFYNLHVVAVASGRFMTALEMHGVSLTLIHIHPTPGGAELQNFLLAPNALIPFSEPLMAPRYHASAPRVKPSAEKADANPVGEDLKAKFSSVIAKVGAKVEEYNKLDGAVGDADMGNGVDRVASVLQDEEHGVKTLPFGEKLVQSLVYTAEVVAEAFAGTSGPLYGTFLAEAAYALNPDAAKNGKKEFLAAFVAGSQAVSDLGGAQVGDRTMYDALAASAAVANALLADEAALEKLAAKEVAQQLADAAQKRSVEVAQLPAKMGRARYLAGKEIGHPDPGCVLVADWLAAIADNL